jgi:hypothetical protein
MKTSAYIFPSLLSLGLYHMSLYTSPSTIRLVLTPRGAPHGYTFGLKASILFLALGSLNHLFGAEER